ncbi:pentapeptide repeat-containing protein [Acaryochloris sp. CCMEE 5410]|uniref:pentapeptide repeat-containing protein n=1 Tax=Acaryochloris sp. CCMEE 5410 TaxID=310037 RepID=UPI00024844AD|nr:pentapeptide repeat-containing protein [Acaryochloris sp. CCMEE 5410]KAI9129124.1 pentapeptide repeat-containing protein [Acaryochloris sp. CCMEE 5410]
MSVFSQKKTTIRHLLETLRQFPANMQWHYRAESLVIEGEDAASKLIAAYQRGVRNFDGSVFPDNSDFYDQTLFGISLAKGRLKQAWFCSGSFRGGCFADAFLERASFDDSDCRDVDFSRADLTGAEFQGTNLRGAKFINAQLQGAYFDRADLVGADLTGANMQDAKMIDVRLVRSDPEFVEL